MLKSGCTYRLASSEGLGLHRDHHQLLTDSYQNPISERQVTIKLHLLADFKNLPLTLVFMWSTCYFIYLFHPHLFSKLHTCLSFDNSARLT